MDLQEIKLIASAVRAGEESAKKGNVNNPFGGLNELLRVAFQIGWITQQPWGVRIHCLGNLLRLAARNKGPRARSAPHRPDIRLIASAVRAGEEAARKGETGNPFDGLNESLRLAFHFGWSATQPVGETVYSLEMLLRVASPLRGPIPDSAH